MAKEYIYSKELFRTNIRNHAELYAKGVEDIIGSTRGYHPPTVFVDTDDFYVVSIKTQRPFMSDRMGNMLRCYKEGFCIGRSLSLDYLD